MYQGRCSSRMMQHGKGFPGMWHSTGLSLMCGIIDSKMVFSPTKSTKSQCFAMPPATRSKTKADHMAAQRRSLLELPGDTLTEIAKHSSPKAEGPLLRVSTEECSSFQFEQGLPRSGKAAARRQPLPAAGTLTGARLLQRSTRSGREASNGQTLPCGFASFADTCFGRSRLAQCPQA
jgi:hypothetical protein